jgi:hypothetical protein
MKRTEYIAFRCSEDEKIALQLFSRYEGRNQSELIREVLRSYFRQRGLSTLSIVPDVKKTLQEIEDGDA